MSKAEINAELATIILEIPQEDVISVREEILFDELTVPPGPGYETNKGFDPKRPGATLRRLTGTACRRSMET